MGYLQDAARPSQRLSERSQNAGECAAVDASHSRQLFCSTDCKNSSMGKDRVI